jgi:hypothetical protein
MITLTDYVSPADRPATGDRLYLEQRRVVASLMEVYGSPTVLRQKFAERFQDEIQQAV